jgi:hypothetical protein
MTCRGAFIAAGYDEVIVPAMCSCSPVSRSPSTSFVTVDTTCTSVACVGVDPRESSMDRFDAGHRDRRCVAAIEHEHQHEYEHDPSGIAASIGAMTFSPDRYVAALRFAAERHRGQLFPGTDLPYLMHVVTVAAETMVALPGAGDPDLVVQCALLHDTIEDTGTRRDEIAAGFGEAVAFGVVALSKDPVLPKSEQMADSLRRIRAQPREVWMVKLADRIANLDAPPAYWPADKRCAYRDEAIVIADALGEASEPLHARIRARIADYARYFTA